MWLDKVCHSVIYCTARPIKSNFISNFYSRIYGLNNTVKHYVLSKSGSSWSQSTLLDCPQTEYSTHDRPVTWPHSGRSGGGAWGARPFIIRPNWRPKGRKALFLRPSPPYIRVWMISPHHPLSEGLDPPLPQFQCFSSKFNFFAKLNANGILV